MNVCVVGRRRIWSRRIGDDVEVMEKNPEYFFGDVDDFFAPDTIRARVVHRCYKAWGLSGLRLGRISQVRQKSARTSR